MSRAQEETTEQQLYSDPAKTNDALNHFMQKLGGQLNRLAQFLIRNQVVIHPLTLLVVLDSCTCADTSQGATEDSIAETIELMLLAVDDTDKARQGQRNRFCRVAILAWAKQRSHAVKKKKYQQYMTEMERFQREHPEEDWSKGMFATLGKYCDTFEDDSKNGEEARKMCRVA